MPDKTWLHVRAIYAQIIDKRRFSSKAKQEDQVNELLGAGIEVARPERDHGTDLIAYTDLAKKHTRFLARPIQMKASSGEQFSINRKYERISDLVLVFVWNLTEPEGPIFALPYAEAIKIGEQMGWLATKSWQEDGVYTTQKPSEELKSLLAPFRTSPEWWEELVTGASPGA